MKRGRKRKPTEQKRRAGNPGKRALRPDVIKVGISLALPPDWLPPGGVIVWAEFAPMLTEQGLLTDMDQETLATLCMAVYAKRAMAQFLVGTLPKGDLLFSEFSRMKDPRKRLLTLREFMNQERLQSPRFGMDPSARGGMTLGGAAKDAELEREDATVRPFSRETAQVMKGGQS